MDINQQVIQSPNIITKIELSLTPEIKKSLSFVGTMQQIVGVLTIISGAMTCLGIIAILFGIPVLISSIRLFNSGSNLSMVVTTGDGKQLALALTNLVSYWKWILINIIIIAVCIFVFFALFATVLSMAVSSH